jgi:hypothetical protein
VIDRVPRNLTPNQETALKALKRQAEAQLELREALDHVEQLLPGRPRKEHPVRTTAGRSRCASAGAAQRPDSEAA